MNEQRAKADCFNWHLLLYAAVGFLVAMVAFLATAFFERDTANLIFIFVSIVFSLVLFAAAIAVAVGGKPRRSLTIVLMLVVFWVVSLGPVTNSQRVRTDARWLLRSKDYKAQVQAQPRPADGQLRHIEWDGWGFPGAGDTVVYLVFDPNDSLASAARSHESGRFNGIPCEIHDIRRLESNWYTALFYTDTDWSHCA